MEEASIPCPGCGRAYSADLFAHGRTLHCTCGARVGRRVEGSVIQNEDPPRFLADAMLGGLARWLRVLGYDAAWEPQIADAELVRRSAEEGRVILTRDRRLPHEWWIENCLLLESDDPLAQLREVAAALSLSRKGLFSRCTRCNAPLQPVPPEEVEAKVPPAVREHRTHFLSCPVCERTYWEGSHTERMRRTLEQALG